MRRGKWLSKLKDMTDKKLSSTKKGDLFEEKVFRIMESCLKKGELHVNTEYSEIFRKKSYYSKDRNSNIVFDITIETSINDNKNNPTNYSLLTVFECKNYSQKSISAEEIEEFSSKLNQVGESNTKGILVTNINTNFQSATIEFAKSKGIGLLRITNKEETEWTLYRLNKSNFEVDSLVNPDQDINTFNIYGLLDNKEYNSLADILIDLGVICKYIRNTGDIDFKYLSLGEIEQQVESLNLFEDLFKDNYLDDQLLCKSLISQYNMQFDTNADLGSIDNSKILGKIEFSPLIISTDKTLISDPNRFRFTLAHEIGHLVLHYNKLKSYFDNYIDKDENLSLDFSTIHRIHNIRFETQANIFASILLIPKIMLLADMKEFFIEEGLHKPFIYLDEQKCNIDLANKILLKIKSKYRVSKAVAKIRLVHLGFLEDKSSSFIKIS